MGRETEINIAASLRAKLFRAGQFIIIAGMLCLGFAMPADASYIPFNTNVNMNVGIGTSTPQGALTVMNGNVGIGTWIPSATLYVNGGVLYGNTSTAGGGTTAAIHVNNSDLGGGYISSQSSATGNIASSGLGSLAEGYIFGTGSAAISNITASGNGAIAMGFVQSLANTEGITASGNGSIAMGAANGNVLLEATGTASVAIGEEDQATADNAFALGLLAQATASDAFAIGYDVVNPNPNSLMIGFTPATGAPTMTVTATGVGIGTSSPFGGGLIVLPANTGNVGIGSLAPGQALDVTGTVRTTGFTLTGNGAASGNILVGNGVGVGTWMPASTLLAGGGTNYWLLNGGGNVGINTTQAVGIGTSFVGGTGEAAFSVMNGNVGIGTWIARAKLDIEGTLSVASFGGSIGVGTWLPASLLDVEDNATTGTAIYGNSSSFQLADAGVIGNNTSTGAGVIGSSHGGIGVVAQNTSGDAALTATSYNGGPSAYLQSGYVGAGASPTLVIQQFSTSTADLLEAQNAGGTSLVNITSSGNVGIGTWQSTGALVVMGGNVGIGSLNPGQLLDIQGTVRTKGLTLTGNGAASGNVLVGNGVGVGTWMPASTLLAGGGTNYWLLNGGNNVGINTTQAVGIGTSFVGGTGEAAFSVMNGNVGIGTWVPAATLDIGNATSGDVQITSAFGGAIIANGAISSGSAVTGFVHRCSGGSVANPCYTDNGSFYSGMYFPDTNTAAFSTVGVERMRIDLNGNIGIGSWAANTINNKLSVAGNIGIGTNQSSSFLQTAAPNGGMIVQGNVGLGSLHPGQALDVSGTVRMTGLTLTGNGAASGNVLVGNGIGVGTWMPASTLLASGGTNYWLLNGGGNVGINTTQAVGIGTSFVGGTGEAAFAVMNGNVGIGTWVPQDNLEVNGSAQFDNGIFSTSLYGNTVATLQINGNNTNPNTNTLIVGSGAATSHLDLQSTQAAGTTDYIKFLVGNNGGTEAMRIVDSGNVGIGSVSPGQKLDVQGTVRTTGFTLTGNGAASGNVLVGNGVGVGTWMPASTLGVSGGSGTNYWLLNGGGNVGINTSYAVGIGTSFVGGTGEAALSVMRGNVGIGTWQPVHDLQIGSYTEGQSSSPRSISLGASYSSTPGQNLKLYLWEGVPLAGNSVGFGVSFLQQEYIVGASNQDHVFFGGGNELLRIKGTGNVGIGTTFVGGAGEAGLSIMNGNVGIGTWVPNGNGNGGLLDIGNAANGDVEIDNTGDMTLSGQISVDGEGVFADGAISSEGFFNASAPAIQGASGGGDADFLLTNSGSAALPNNSSGAGIQIEGAFTTAGAGTHPLIAGAAIFPMTITPGGASITNTAALYIDSAGTATVTGNKFALWVNSGNSDFGGNVGISSTAPGQSLDVQGTVRMKGLTLTGNGAAAGNVLVGNGVGVGTWMPASTLLAGGGTNYWLLNGGTNVGINTTQAVGIGTSFVGGIGEAALSVMNGNVGIGTWVPTTPLNVVSAGGDVAMFKNLNASADTDNGFTDSTGINRLWLGYGNSSSGAPYANHDFIEYDNTDLIFAANNGSLLNVYLTNGGFVGIGTVTPLSKLNVNGGLGIGTTLTNNAYLGGNPAPSGGLIVQGNVGIGTFNPFGGGLIVLPVNTGNVGIGSLTPGQSVDVQGTVRMTGLTLSGNGAASGNVLIGNGVGVGTWMPASTLSGSINGLTTNYVTKALSSTSITNSLIFDTGVNVGIGSVNPGAALDVVGMISVEGAGNSYFSSNLGIGSTAPGQALDVNGTARMTGFILTGNGAGSGNVLVGNGVGVGTWMPASTLAASAGTNYWLLNAGAGNVGINTSYAVGIGTSFVGGTGEAALSVMNGNVGIGTWLPADRFQVGKYQSTASGFEVDSNGNVGIGTTITNNAPLVIMNGNLGIGTWAPAYTIETQAGDWHLGNFGNLWIDSGSVINFGPEGQPVPQITGSFLSPTNFLALSINGTANSLVIDGNGNVGIGTDTVVGGMAVMNGNVGIGSLVPGQTLDIQGTARMKGFILTGNGAAPGSIMVTNSIGIGTWMPINTIAAAGAINSQTANQIAYYNSPSPSQTLVGSASMVFNAPNVGLGTVTPLATLQVVGNIGIGTVKNGDNFITTAPPNGGEIIEGNVGVGSWAPGQKLDVQGSLRDLGEFVNGNVGIGTTFVNAANESSLTVMNGNVGIGTWAGGGALVVMNGNVGIGTTNPTYQLAVSNNAFIKTATQNKSTFMAVSYGSGTGTQQNFTLTGGAFTKVNFNALSNYTLIDNGGNYSAANNWYVTPVSGIYMIITKLRVTDSQTQFISYGQGAGTAAADTPTFLWCQTATTTATRNGSQNIQFAHYAAGSDIEMFAYATTTITSSDGAFQIYLVTAD